MLHAACLHRGELGLGFCLYCAYALEQSSRLNLICDQVGGEVSLAARQNKDGWCSVPILIPFGGRTCKSQPAVWGWQLFWPTLRRHACLPRQIPLWEGQMRRDPTLCIMAWLSNNFLVIVLGCLNGPLSQTSEASCTRLSGCLSPGFAIVSSFVSA